MTRKLKHISVMLLIVVAQGCATQRNSQKEIQSGSAPTNWTKFFSDSVLRSLIDTAISANPDVLIAQQRIETATAAYMARRYALLPQVGVRASLGQRRFGAYTMDGVGNYDTRFSPNITTDQIIPEHLPDYFLGLQASWEADIWGKLRNRSGAARARLLRMAEGKNWVITNLIADIASTYYELLSLDREIAILDDFIRLQENAEQVIVYQKEAGQTTELAVQQFRAQTLGARNMRIETQQRITDAENRLNSLLGRLPGHIPRNSFAFTDSLTLPGTIPPTLVSQRPDIRAAEQEIKESGYNVEAARAAFYPSLGVDALLGLQSFNPQFFFSPASITYHIVGALTAPLLNRTALKAELRIANSNQRTALYNYRKTVLSAYREVGTEMANVRNLRRMYELKEQEALVNSAAVETANALFRTGRATYLEVIITQKNSLLTNLELVRLRERQLRASIRLYKALGGG